MLITVASMNDESSRAVATRVPLRTESIESRSCYRIRDIIPSPIIAFGQFAIINSLILALDDGPCINIAELNAGLCDALTRLIFDHASYASDSDDNKIIVDINVSHSE